MVRGKNYFASRVEITDRILVEEKNRQDEEFGTSLLNNSPNPILVINPDTSIKYINPAFEKLTRFSSSELIGRKFPYPYWPENEASTVRPALQTKGKLKCYVINWVDVTERKRAQETLKESETFNSSLLKNFGLRVFGNETTNERARA